MKEYILERMSRNTSNLNFNGVQVEIVEGSLDTLSIKKMLHTLQKILPFSYFRGVKKISIGQLPDFKERNINALYRDDTLFISNEQDNVQDILDDITHEMAHHLETVDPEFIYGDELLVQEFHKKRAELKYEITTEGYWVDKYDFRNLKYDEGFDNFLYKRIGKKMLASITTGMFIRPYAAVSMREYFATGFEAYYLGSRDNLHKISPELFKKIIKLEEKA
jgi:hypothetical protein